MGATILPDSVGRSSGLAGYNVGMDSTRISYHFHFPQGHQRVYDVELDTVTGRLIAAPMAVEHIWTKLEHKQCAHCPLNQSDQPHCPVARNLASVADDFKDERSFDKITVEVLTPERTYRKQLPMQEGLYGLFGLIMATSECPYFEFLRPMARFHLPFSTYKETIVRSVSFYLLRQYFVAKRGGASDFELSQLPALYDALEIVNRGMVARIRSMTRNDADANSIIILDGFAKLLSLSLSNGLQDLEFMFTS